MPASGYYEWLDGKQPYYFTSRDGSILAFAGSVGNMAPERGRALDRTYIYLLRIGTKANAPDWPKG